jgi:UDP-glucose 4-epimerase
LTVVGSGEQRRDFTHVSDVVEANVLAATTHIADQYMGGVFNVGTGRNYSINELVKLYDHDSVNIPERPGEAKETLANHEKIKAILGWSPVETLENWISVEKT